MAIVTVMTAAKILELIAAGNRAATETATGMVELATTTEATTGTDTVRAVTPAGVKAVADTKANVSHTHTASQVSDSTATGRALVTAADAAAARGTLALGTAATTAATAYATAVQGVKADAALQPNTVTGMLAGNGTTTTGRTITGTADEITVTNGSGASGNPTLSLALTAAKVGDLPIPDPGSFYPTDTITAALQLIGGRERYGTGSPEGVVTAPVGTYYTDTAITNGAMRWAKKTGTGNTGWQCVEGDTGWRNISSLLVNGWTGSAYVKRTAEVITLELDAVVGNAATATTVLTLPVGFRVTTRNSRLLYHTTATALKRFILDTSGALTFLGVVPEASTVYGQGLTPPDNAWPTTLPGVAV